MNGLEIVSYRRGWLHVQRLAGKCNKATILTFYQVNQITITDDTSHMRRALQTLKACRLSFQILDPERSLAF